MPKFVKIQQGVFCENCIICGRRPVIEQSQSRFIVRCPTSSEHYQTKIGLIDIDDWNRNNKPDAEDDKIKKINY